MKNIFLLITMSVYLLGVFSCSNRDKTKEERLPVVMAYFVAGEDYKPENVPVEKLTHIIYSFSNVIDGLMKFRDPEASGEKLKGLVSQKSRNPDLKVMIACGGWGADGFSDMASTAENRKAFVQSTMDFIEKYQLDGVDIDWEYPAIPAAGTGARAEDKQNFTLLMKELREALDKLDRPQTLTFASAGWKRYYENIETLEVMKYVDFMNVMTYDQVGASSPYTAHHTALGYITEQDMGEPFVDYMESLKEEREKRGYSWEPRSVEKIIDFILEKGVNAEQLVVGAAFYGRAWKGVDPADKGLYQSNEGSHIGWVSYDQIRGDFESDPDYKRYWDPVAKAPFLYSDADSIFVSYDDTVSVRMKTRYAMDKSLGGIMFWELGNDTKTPNGLLDAIDREVKQ